MSSFSLKESNVRVLSAHVNSLFNPLWSASTILLLFWSEANKIIKDLLILKLKVRVFFLCFGKLTGEWGVNLEWRTEESWRCCIICSKWGGGAAACATEGAPSLSCWGCRAAPWATGLVQVPLLHCFVCISLVWLSRLGSRPRDLFFRGSRAGSVLTRIRFDEDGFGFCSWVFFYIVIVKYF